MIQHVLIFINVVIFFALGIIHFYWAFGGTWAVEYTIPDKFKDNYFNIENKSKVVFATILVACGLIIMSIITASNFYNLDALIPRHWTVILTRIIGLIFILRAIGDFNIVGIFKKQSNSKFSNKDNQIFIPLCLYIGISSILITF